ncbi:MAG: hypothetical protein FJ145_16835, partial [Deltaproteobacteria bacterium]|nr:hypothetical protein [Deltaproteobacteria bacterium]
MAADEKAVALAGQSLSGATGELAAPRKRSASSTAARTLGLRAVSIAAMTFVWWLLTFFYPPSLIPLPSSTFNEVVSIMTSGQFFAEMGATLRRV